MASPDPAAGDADAGLRTLQIIVSGLIGGVVMFAVIASTVAPIGQAGTNLDALRIGLGLVFISGVPAVFVLRRLMLRPGGTGSPNPYATPEPAGDGASDPNVLQRFTAGTIMSCAIMEGIALFAVVVFLMSGSPIDLVAAAVPLAIMGVGFFPTRGRWEAFARRAD